MRALRRLVLLIVLAAVAATLVRRRRPLPTGDAPTWPPLDVVLRATRPEPAPTVAPTADTPLDAGEVSTTAVVEPGVFPATDATHDTAEPVGAADTAAVAEPDAVLAMDEPDEVVGTDAVVGRTDSVGAIATGEPDDTARVDVSTMTPTWVEPVDGGCPVGYPVKANASSGIFHVPGGRSYARTRPERCYAGPEDAEADGFRRAKL